MAIVDVVHEAHVRGGRASHLPPTDWRAKYGEVPRATRVELVAAARSRLASDPFALSALSSIRQVDMVAPALEETTAILPEHGDSAVRAGAQTERRDRSGLSSSVAAGPKAGDLVDSGSIPPAASVADEGRPVRAGHSRQPERASARPATADEPRAHSAAARTTDATPMGRGGPLTPSDRGDAGAPAMVPTATTSAGSRTRAASRGGGSSGDQSASSTRLEVARSSRAPRSDRKKAPDWTDADRALYRELIGKVPLEEVARRLGRTVIAIENMRWKIGATQRANTGGLSAAEVAEIMGVDSHQVTDAGWIAWGLLRGKQIEFLHAGAHSRQWLIRREDLVDFLIDCPWQYDRERITDPFFRRVADEAWTRDPLYTSDEAARVLGLKEGHGFTHLVRNTLPKIIERRYLVVRRRGRPGASGASMRSQPVFVHRSLIERIQASGWRNYREIASDPDHWTAEGAIHRLMVLPDRPPYLKRTVLRERLQRFYRSGAIASREVSAGATKRYRVADKEAVLALKDALFARVSSTLRLTAARRGLLARHDPRWLADPAELARGLADGRLRDLFRIWWAQEQRAAAELRSANAKEWALVTRHVAQELELLGPKTKLGSKRRAIFHRSACQRNLVAIPLKEARRRGLQECGWCAFQRQHPSMRPASRQVQRRGRFVTCAVCGEDFRRGRGRPAREPRCSRCALRRAA